MRSWLVVLLSVFSAHSAMVGLAWDPSPTAGVTYRLYATSDSNTNVYSWPVKVDVDTNLMATVFWQTQTNSNWRFAATAMLDGVESDPSNILPVIVPRGPTNVVTVAIEHTVDLNSAEWQEVGFFRLRIGR